ncbi:hypothetical protein [Streptomyces albus]|uniref:hypothetical protein n=1 Tax=Streptomyces albus TaxID=1888 RepID=UPI003F1A59AB
MRKSTFGALMVGIIMVATAANAPTAFALAEEGKALEEGNGPRIVSGGQNGTGEGGGSTDMAPVGEPSEAHGDRVTAYIKAAEEISGGKLLGVPQVEKYNDGSESVQFTLSEKAEIPENENPGNDVFVTRSVIKKDVDKEALGGEADVSLKTLETGSQILSSLDADGGVLVVTLSKQGNLTAWNVPEAKTESELATVEEWATEADRKDPGEVRTAHVASALKAAPKCKTTLWKPFAGSKRIKVNGRLLCDQKGAIYFKAFLLQYRAATVWVGKASERVKTGGASVAVATPSWKCRKGENQLYRGRATTRSLKNSNGKWYKSGAVNGPKKRLTCK